MATEIQVINPLVGYWHFGVKIHYQKNGMEHVEELNWYAFPSSTYERRQSVGQPIGDNRIKWKDLVKIKETGAVHLKYAADRMNELLYLVPEEERRWFHQAVINKLKFLMIIGMLEETGKQIATEMGLDYEAYCTEPEVCKTFQ